MKVIESAEKSNIHQVDQWKNEKYIIYQNLKMNFYYPPEFDIIIEKIE